MKQVLALVAALFITPATAEDYSQYKELFLVNQAGGVIALTVEPCQIPEAKGFDSRAYATEGNGTKHEGCWMAPDISDAPNYPGVKIIPIVNVWFDGVIVPLEQGLFAPIAKLDGGV